MVIPFICGTGNFHHHQQEEEDDLYSPCSTPRRPRKDSKNPYANIGLDKFAALLAELEDKRQRIYTQKGSEDISFVRFVFSNTEDIKPIVVKAREKKHEIIQNKKPMIHNDNNNSEALEESSIESSTSDPNEVQNLSPEIKSTKKKKRQSGEVKMGMRRPSCYLAVVMVLILLFLAVFGRSFAILCTCVGWYLVPNMKKRGWSSEKSHRKKKEYARGASEKNIIVCSDGIAGGVEGVSPPQHGRRKSWSK